MRTANTEFVLFAPPGEEKKEGQDKVMKMSDLKC
jgi:hypothetical protein